MDEWQLVKQAEANFVRDRDAISQNNTVLRVFELLKLEIAEAEEAYFQAQAHMEVGNIDESEKWEDEYSDELGDIGIFLMALFRMADTDMILRIKENIGYNNARFPASECNDGDWEDIYPELKRQVKQSNMKQEFTGREDGVLYDDLD